MSANIYCKMILGGLVLGFNLFVTSAADWDSCADDLDRLRRAARDATDKANNVKSQSEKLDDCMSDPDTNDYANDGCSGQAADYQNAHRDLESELDTVDRRIRSASASCEYNLGATKIALKPKSEPSGLENRTCALLQSYRGKLPLDQLMKFCTQSALKSQAECKKCLKD